MEEPNEFSLKEVIRTLQELHSELEDGLPEDLLPEVAHKLEFLRENVRKLLGCLTEGREELPD